jgi:hypothetical protein
MHEVIENGCFPDIKPPGLGQHVFQAVCTESSQTYRRGSGYRRNDWIDRHPSGFRFL